MSKMGGRELLGIALTISGGVIIITKLGFWVYAAVWLMASGAAVYWGNLK